MIKCLALVNPGLEDVAAHNVSGILDKKINAKDIHKGSGIIRFSVEDAKALLKVIYLAQSVNKVLIELFNIDKVDTDDSITQDIDAALVKNTRAIKSFIPGGSSFCVRGKSSLSEDMEKKVGHAMFNYSKSHTLGWNVDLKNPTFNIVVTDFSDKNDNIKHHDNIKNHAVKSHDSKNDEKTICIVGVDCSGELSKRDYRIFNSNMSLKGVTAFGLLMLAGYKPEDKLLDPYCNSGTLTIEAALYSTGKSHRFYEKKFPLFKIFPEMNDDFEESMQDLDRTVPVIKPHLTGADPLLRNITAAKKNAKIAGVNEYIEFRRIDIDWSDLKYDERSIDKIITFIPGSSRHRDQKKLIKEYDQFFYQMEYILKKKGVLVIMCITKELLISAASKYLKLSDEYAIYSGEQNLNILFFKGVSE
jgi:23S rRNA G2445 N2-methylase RlmL